MKLIAPSVLSANFPELRKDLEMINRSDADWLHVDVMDGVFVPNISFGFPLMEPMRKYCTKPLDVHLMITKPIRYAGEFVRAGADMLTVHVEADTEENTLACLKEIRALGCRAAISLKPGTPAEAARPFLPWCDMILVMTVEPGFGGQKFMADQMAKLRALREMLREENPGCLLQVDGGVDPQTCGVCKENGAQVLVAGSAYFRAPDRAAFVRQVQAEK